MRRGIPPAFDGVTLRPAFPNDEHAIARLAALDSRPIPPPPLLLAEIDGEPWAALSLKTGTTIADPFRPTTALLDLLRRRHAQLAAAEPRLRRGAPLRLPRRRSAAIQLLP